MRLGAVALLLSLLGTGALRADEIADLASRIEELARKEAPLPRRDTAERAARLLSPTRPELAAKFRALEDVAELIDVPQPVTLPALPATGPELESAVQRLVRQVEESGDDPASYEALAMIVRTNDLSAGLDNPSIRARIALADLADLLHPDFVLTGLDGRQIHLNDYRGKTVLLAFWATWCIPCRDELARLERIRAASKDIVVLAISHEDPAIVRDFLREHPYRLPIYIDAGHKLSDRFHIDMVPTTLELGPDGRLKSNGRLK